MHVDCYRASPYSLASLKSCLKGGQVEGSEGGLFIHKRIVVVNSGRSVINVKTVVIVVVHVCGNESDIISESSVVILVEIRAFIVRLAVIVVAFLGVGFLAGKLLFTCKSKSYLATLNACVEVEVLSKLDVEAIVAKESLEQLKLRSAAVDLVEVHGGIEAKVDVLVLDLKVEYVNVQNLSYREGVFVLGGIDGGIGYGQTYLKGRVGYKILNRQSECACSTVHHSLGGQRNIIL